MFKNLTPKQVAFCSAASITIFSCFQIIIFNIYSIIDIKPLSLMMFPITFIFVYFIVLFFIKHYIYRRIKLLYKLIHHNKVSAIKSKEATEDLSLDILGNVTDEVIMWGQEQTEIIIHLKSLEQLRREFVGNVAHELKTPIFNVQGFITTLLDGALNNQDTLIKYLKRASYNVDRLESIVKGLDLIYNLEQKQFVINSQRFEIKALIKEVFEEIENTALDKGIQLSINENNREENIFVWGDRDSIRQVLVNLLINSIKYGIYKGYTKIGITQLESNILIEIKDNGIGIDDQHIPHLFERFYRVDKSRSRQAGGSGLGLAIVKHIIEAHDQSVFVRSSIGKGTTFGFTLAKNKQKN